MKCRNACSVRFVNTSGGPPEAIPGSGKSLRFGSSQPSSLASATRTPKSSVQFGAKLKFSARSHRLCFPFGGAVKGVTSSRSSPFSSSPTSRTLAGMQSQSRFFSAHATWRTQPSSVQCYCGQRQSPAPNPSFEPTPTGKPAVAAQVKR